MGIEYELKFRAEPDQQEALLKALALPTREIRMETTYYDTPAGELSRRHITLRRRMENELSVCTVKVPAPGGARGEWECHCPRIEDAIDELCKLGAPAELPHWVTDGLAPVCGAKFTRLAADIVTPEFTAELALDRGVLLGGGGEIPLCEVELELKSGDRSAMDGYTRILAARFGLISEKKSKFARAKALAEEGNHGGI